MYKKTAVSWRQSVNKHDLIMTQKLALPFDEIVLSLVGTHVEENGQLTLFYDDSAEPPDPDDYPSVEAYNSAWQCWSERNPQLVSDVRAMSDDKSDELKIGSRFVSKYADITYTLIAIRDPGQNLTHFKQTTAQRYIVGTGMLNLSRLRI